jgi:hypothetical protein
MANANGNECQFQKLLLYPVNYSKRVFEVNEVNELHKGEHAV